MMVVLAAFLLVFTLLLGRCYVLKETQTIFAFIPRTLMVFGASALLLMLIYGRFPAFLTTVLALSPLGLRRDLWHNRTSEKSFYPDAVVHDTQALSILGLPEGCSAAQIQAQHRKLIQKLHPDKGGSAYLASVINQARDVLLSQRDAAEG